MTWRVWRDTTTRSGGDCEPQCGATGPGMCSRLPDRCCQVRVPRTSPATGRRRGVGLTDRGMRLLLRHDARRRRAIRLASGRVGPERGRRVRTFHCQVHRTPPAAAGRVHVGCRRTRSRQWPTGSSASLQAAAGPDFPVVAPRVLLHPVCRLGRPRRRREWLAPWPATADPVQVFRGVPPAAASPLAGCRPGHTGPETAQHFRRRQILRGPGLRGLGHQSIHLLGKKIRGPLGCRLGGFLPCLQFLQAFFPAADDGLDRLRVQFRLAVHSLIGFRRRDPVSLSLPEAAQPQSALV